jgi:cell volume regulation protein A
MDDAELILAGGALLVGGLFATAAAGRLRVPGLVLFLLLGMTIGSDGTGWVEFSNYELARTIGVLALALILFEGGLTVGFGEIRPVIGVSISLAILGTLLTAGIAGAIATLLFDLSLLEGLLLGSILSATDGAAIFGLLRYSTLERRTARTLEGEAGMNDPIAILLVVGLIDWIELPDYGLLDMLLLFLRELGIGLAVGLAVGWIAIQALRRTRLGTEAGYPVGTIGFAALAFGGAQTLHGSGFLAVYLAGLVLGSVEFPAKRAVTVFHEGLAWVAQVSMFVVLGLLVFPSQLGGVALEGTVLALALVFVARPAATLVATAIARFDMRERAILAWAGLRGAIPVVLATFPVIEGVPGSLEFFNIVFFAVLVSTVLQGSTFEPLARVLRATTSEPALGRKPPPRPARAIAQVSSTGPWREEYGDPAYPNQIGDVPVVRQLGTRIDRPGALVALADGRYAFTGPVVAVGSARAVRRAARQRLARAGSDPERAWWREVIGGLTR